MPESPPTPGTRRTFAAPRRHGRAGPPDRGAPARSPRARASALSQHLPSVDCSGELELKLGTVNSTANRQLPTANFSGESLDNRRVNSVSLQLLEQARTIGRLAERFTHVDRAGADEVGERFGE